MKYTNLHLAAFFLLFEDQSHELKGKTIYIQKLVECLGTSNTKYTNM